MKPERWKEIDKLFDAVLQIAPEKRSEFLENACNGDENLRREIESLLASDHDARNSIEVRASEIAADLLAEKRARFTPGQMIGPYEILSTLGKGGMGEVFRARDPRLEREVAIKILTGRLAENASAMSRFAREAKALAALSHPNILAIYDFGTDRGISYAVMELLKGQTLREKLASSQKLSEAEATEIGTAIANGLTAAHSANVIHRDLKPDNIFITLDGGVKILDFGLAQRGVSNNQQQISAAKISESEVGVVMGTVPYMSPEQVRAENIDTRSDIFSFGAVLFEMLSGLCFFERKTAADTISAILNEIPPDVSASAEVNQILKHCLEKNPDQRFQTARDLLSALKSTSTGTQNVVGQGSTFSSPTRTVVISLISVLLLLTIAGSYYLLTNRSSGIETLAVMPFVNASRNADVEYLSDGITESIIHSLSSLPKLRVMGRDTVFTYKNKQMDPKKIGHDLNVQAVVTGTVDQHGDTLVVRANLISASDGSELWGDQYNQKLSDVLNIQSQISQQISQKLRMKLTGAQKEQLARFTTDNPEAYRLYVKGQYYFWRNTEEDYEKARGYFQKALDVDPSYAEAHESMGDYYEAMALEGFWSPEEAWPKAHAAWLDALRLNSEFADVYRDFGMYECMYKWDWQESEKNLKQAQEVQARTPQSTHHGCGSCLCLIAAGRFDEAIKITEETMPLNPLSRVASVNYGQILAMAGKYDQAINQLKQTILLDPTFDAPHFSLAQIYENEGKIPEAVAETIEAYHLQENDEAADLFKDVKDAAGFQEATNSIARFNLESLTELAKKKYVSPFEFARLHAKLNEKDAAFEWLEKSYNERSTQIIFIRVLDDFKKLRSDPRFNDLVKRIGLPS